MFSFEAIKPKIPRAIKNGAKVVNFCEAIRTATEVPISAPNMVINAVLTPIRPWPAKDAEIKTAAVLLCKSAATMSPDKNAGKALPSERRANLFRLVPYERITPVRTILSPHKRSAIDPKSSIKSVILFQPFCY